MNSDRSCILRSHLMYKVASLILKRHSGVSITFEVAVCSVPDNFQSSGIIFKGSVDMALPKFSYSTTHSLCHVREPVFSGF